MTDFVSIEDIDPHCLDLPDPGPHQGERPSASVAEGREPRGLRISMALCLSMAAALHGMIVMLGLSVAVGLQAPGAPISISLLPGVVASGPSEGAGKDSGPLAPSLATSVARPEPIPPQAEKAAPERTRPAKAAPRQAVRVTRRESSRVAHEPAPPKAVEAAPAAESDEAASSDKPSGGVSVADIESEPVVPAGEVGGGTGGGGSGAGAGAGVPGEGIGTTMASFGDADGPRFVQRVMPRYPDSARRRGREGLVVLRLSIDADGVLRDIRIVEKAGFGLDEAALEAARASTYAPAWRFGRPVRCEVLLPVRFALKEG